jgi:uncharacterized protein YecE (DUF72 family)
MDNKGEYYSGTSGLLLPVPNKEFFPEAFKTKSRLCYYGSLYNSIEINSSFYKVPMASTVARWATEVPDDFKFTFKLWREITHSKSLKFNLEAVDDFMRRISAVGDKKGCLLVQFPGSIRPVHLPLVERLLGSVRKSDPDVEWKVAVEFRHQSWYQQDTFDLMDRYGMALVLHDKLSEGGAVIENQTDFVYVRFHGPSGDYKGSYEKSFLYEYASYINEWLEEGKQVYTYFNNTIGNALKNMESLRSFL